MAAVANQEAGKPGKAAEIGGLLLLVAAVLLGLSLLSYFVGDPSLNTVAHPPIKPGNWAGRIGAYAADLMLQYGGYASIFFPVVLAIVGFFFFSGRRVSLKLSQIFGYLILLAALASLMAFFIPKHGTSTLSGGGEIGQVLADMLAYALGSVGGFIVTIAILLISLIITINFSFAGAGAWLWGRLSAAGAAAGAWWTVRREARKRRIRRDSRDAGHGLERPQPVIHIGEEKPLKPTARESRREKKPLRNEEPEPVRSTRIDLLEEPSHDLAGPETSEPAWSEPPEPPRPKEPKPAQPKMVEHEEVTIHEQAETESARQISFSGLAGQYEPPPLDIFQNPPVADKELNKEALLAQAVAVESKLETFNITGKVVEIHPGPVITMYEYEPAPGIKISQIANRDDDLAMALQAEKIRIIAPIPGKGAVGIEVPSLRREIVYLREILESKEFNEADHPLTMAMGKDSTGAPMVQNLARMPHLLVAGTTGSGKSVFLNSVILSLMYKSTPEEVRLLMVDPKQLELAMYTDTPHMLHPVIVEPKKAALMLRWAVSEMEERYRRMAEMGVRNIDNFNEKVAKLLAKTPRKGRITGEGAPEMPEKMPYIVLVIDEMADLMMVAAKEVEDSIARLAQMARAAGMHLIMATQRPSVDVITGVIKANFPARISFQVRTRTDSRTILDETGAHNLLGLGDALFLPPGTGKLTRFHAPLITDEEVHAAVNYLKEKHPRPYYVEIRTPSGADLHEASLDEVTLDDDVDEGVLYDKAIDIVARDRKASVSYLQRRLKIGYNRAARLIERMEQEGLISPSDGTSRPRDIHIPERDYD